MQDQSSAVSGTKADLDESTYSECTLALDSRSRVRVGVRGPTDGTPVLRFHGTPSCRLERSPLPNLLHKAGVRQHVPERPGYGASRPAQFSFAEVAGSIATYVDSLGLERVALLGASGGGPYALVFAARYPERVTRVALTGCPAPSGKWGFFEGMSSRARFEWELILSADPRAGQVRESLIAAIETDPVSAAEAFLSILNPAERLAVSGPNGETRETLANILLESFRQGGAGWGMDEENLASDWEPIVREIQTPVRLWCGELDDFIPIGHGQRLAAILPATLVVKAASRHLHAVFWEPEILKWLTDV